LQGKLWLVIKNTKASNWLIFFTPLYGLFRCTQSLPNYKTTTPNEPGGCFVLWRRMVKRCLYYGTSFGSKLCSLV